MSRMATPASSSDVETLLRDSTLFSKLTAAEAAELRPAWHRVQLERGQVLFEEGARGGGLWSLGRAPRVRIVCPSRGTVLATLGEGETVGEMALVDEGPRSATARVEAGGEAVYLDAASFQ